MSTRSWTSWNSSYSPGMFLLGGVSGLAAYHAEVGAVWWATGRNTWSWEGAVESFALGGLFAMGGKALGSFLRARVMTPWINEFDRAYAATEARFGPRPAGAGASDWSTRLHEIFQRNVNRNLFLRLTRVRAPLEVNGAGPDSTWPAGKTFFEVTTYGEIWAHVNRATFQPYLDAGWTAIFMTYA